MSRDMSQMSLVYSEGFLTFTSPLFEPLRAERVLLSPWCTSVRLSVLMTCITHPELAIRTSYFDYASHEVRGKFRPCHMNNPRGV